MVVQLFNKSSGRVSFRRQQEIEELNQVVEQETERTKFELIKEVERDMQGNRDYILGTFGKLVRDNNLEAFEGIEYLKNVEDLIAPILDMEWFNNSELLRDENSMDEVFNRQMKFIEDNIKDVEKRIAEEEAKGDEKK